MRLLVTGGSGFLGTNYVDLIASRVKKICNIDRNPPKKPSHRRFWVPCDLQDSKRVRRIVSEFQPSHVLHLAAKTGIRGSEVDFEENKVGAENLLSAVRSCDTVERIIVTSSALVCEIGYIPESDTDYSPSTPYGQSKVDVERVTREASNLGCSWSIIRPVSIWGPWCEEPYRNLFNAIKAGWYCHIGAAEVKKSLGYVENTVAQIHNLFEAAKTEVHGKTMYVADHPPVTLRRFTELVRDELEAPTIKTMPRSVAKAAACIGDFLQAMGWEGVPLTRFRLNNILTEYAYDVSPIRAIAGRRRFSVKEGVRRTADWLRSEVWEQDQ